jgi:hypothetical protein
MQQYEHTYVRVSKSLYTRSQVYLQALAGSLHELAGLFTYASAGLFTRVRRSLYKHQQVSLYMHQQVCLHAFAGVFTAVARKELG